MTHADRPIDGLTGRAVAPRDRAADAIPKADLHLHQELSPRLDLVLAARSSRPARDWTQWRTALVADVPAGIQRLHKLSADFPVPESVDADDDLFVSRVGQLLEESAADGSLYVEVRFGKETPLREGFMDLFRSAEARVQHAYPRLRAEPVATIVTFLDRDHVERLTAWCVGAAKDGLAGVDLLYQPYEREADWRPLYRLSERLASAGLGITAHAGEFSAANIAAAAAAPGLTRIGHGIHAADDPRLLELLAQRGITLECCLTSNVVLGAVPSLAAHPLRKLIAAGVRVALGSDNPVQLGTTIGTEYDRAALLGCTRDELIRFTRIAITSSFTSSERRRQMLFEIDQWIAHDSDRASG
jgi:adenosine deaminase